MDHSKLNLPRGKDIIIPRALFATNEETFATDIIKLEQFYSKNIILKYLKTKKERISNEVCAMVAKRYNVPTFARFKQI
jgi:hypothetical protein